MNHKRLAIFLLALLLPALAFSQTTVPGNQRNVRTYTVTITSNIRGAEIYVNGDRQRQTTPATMSLQAGTYTIRVQASGYRPWSQTVVVNTNMTITADLIRPIATIRFEVPREYLNLEVRNPESQIQFYVDDQLRRESEFEVRSGTHRVTIVSGGLRFDGDVYFEAGVVYTLELILSLNLLQTLSVQGR